MSYDMDANPVEFGCCIDHVDLDIHEAREDVEVEVLDVR